MPDILVRGLDADVVKRLKKRAKEEGRSLQSEARMILEQEADTPKVDRKKARKLIEDIRRRFKGRNFPDSVKLIREERNR